MTPKFFNSVKLLKISKMSLRLQNKKQKKLEYSTLGAAVSETEQLFSLQQNGLA